MSNRIKALLSSNFKSQYKLKDEIKDALSTSSGSDEEAALVDEDTSKDEFVLRYGNAKILAFILLIMLSFTLYILVFVAGDFFGQAISLMSAAIFSISYLKLSFRLWCARNAYADWENRAAPKTIMMSDFIDSCRLQLSQLFPIAIENCNGKHTD